MVVGFFLGDAEARRGRGGAEGTQRRGGDAEARRGGGIDVVFYLWDMKLRIDVLARICEIPGVPGHEQAVTAYLKAQLSPYISHFHVDGMGNLTCTIPGKSDQSIMVAAHMDEIGFMVTHIEPQGSLRITPLGGFDPKTLTAQRVWVHGKKDVLGVMGSKPIHIMDAEERNKAPKISDFFIDLGLPYEEVIQLVSIGDVVTRERDLVQMGPCVNAKSLDNRVSVYVLMETLIALAEKPLPFTFHGVFTVQEEVGIRGAQAAALRLNPDFGLGLDTTIAYDVPGAAAHEQVTSLGKGVAIKWMDASAIAHPSMVKYLKSRAIERQIPWQPEILTAGGTDTAAIQRFNPGGAITGALSIPTRHIHQVIEMCHTTDIEAAIDLLSDSILHLDAFPQS